MTEPLPKVRDTAPAAGLGLIAAGTASATGQDVRQLAIRQATVLKSLCEFLDQASLRAGLQALVDELQRRFRCERVGIALCEGNETCLRALSQQPDFDPRAAETVNLAAAMREACEQDRVIHLRPDRPPPDPLQVPAHNVLRNAYPHYEICSLPICHGGTTLGALMLMGQRAQPLSGSAVVLLQQVTTIIAPVLQLRISDEQSVMARSREHLVRRLRDVFGPTHLAAKCVAIGAALTLLIAAVLPVTYRVSATAELLPLERRMISAPIPSFIEQVHVETGDRVQPGTPLVTLDTRDLKLERDKWANDIAGTRAEFRAAMASTDRKEMAVVLARQQQAEAQLALIDAQIDRATIRAPAAGVVTSEDLSQSLGAPVERGDVLLEIAPEGDYKVVLWVDEEDMVRIQPGQEGELALKASPADGMAFRVTEIHPIAVARDGLTRLRVEAALTGTAQGLRPGQTGIGKIGVGSATLLWTWTHRFTDWLSRQWWAWFG
ncbi:MAG: HlyD family efflux transporter periplasmic adaptor subunit [Pseudomonadales bacterium]|nr:HlyD family efflux transporter periplasmic adaptor subunit [Pseudomonadales bacterium]